MNKKLISTPVVQLQPRWTEFTATKGVLRLLQARESKTRATGMVFLCPWCKADKETQHYCIFLFDDERVGPLVKPPGRFVPTYVFEGDLPQGKTVPEDFKTMSLRQLHGKAVMESYLKPGDLKCGWEGTLTQGVVVYREKERSLIDRIFRWK